MIISSISQRIKYYIFLITYFKEPLIGSKNAQIAKLRRGGVFNTFGYGYTVPQIYRTWKIYGISINEAKRYRTVIDIGGHIGLFSVFLGVLNPKCKIFCFEMVKDNFNKLRQNIKNCGLKNIISLNLAITDKTQDIEYYKGGDCSGFTTKKIDFFFSGKKPRSEKNMKSIGKVKSITLNEIFDIKSVDYLKFNCEGAEFEIIYSTNEKNLKKITKMGIQYHEHKNYKIDDLVKYLSKYGDVKKIESQKGMGTLYYIKR